MIPLKLFQTHLQTFWRHFFHYKISKYLDLKYKSVGVKRDSVSAVVIFNTCCSSAVISCCISTARARARTRETRPYKRDLFIYLFLFFLFLLLFFKPITLAFLDTALIKSVIHFLILNVTDKVNLIHFDVYLFKQCNIVRKKNREKRQNATNCFYLFYLY